MKTSSLSLSFVAALAILALPHVGAAQAARKSTTSAHVSAKPAAKITKATLAAAPATEESEALASAATTPIAEATVATTSQPEGASSSKASSSAKDIFWGPMPSGSKWDKGAAILQLGLGVDWNRIGGFVAADFGVHPRIGVGGILGYSSYPGYYYYAARRSITVGGRGTYHIALKPETFDIYAGIMLGVNIYSYHYKDNYTNSVFGTSNGVGLASGPFIGAKWYFSPNISLFGEVGAGLGYLNGGIAFKLK